MQRMTGQTGIYLVLGGVVSRQQHVLLIDLGPRVREVDWEAYHQKGEA
jgi:hypothetical protein